MRGPGDLFTVVFVVIIYVALWIGGCDFPYQMAYGLGELARAVADGYGRR